MAAMNDGLGELWVSAVADQTLFTESRSRSTAGARGGSRSLLQVVILAIPEDLGTATGAMVTYTEFFRAVNPRYHSLRCVSRH
jgi:hypothetical protein